MQRRRVAGLVLCGLGAALVVLAPLLHWWVGPSLIKSPKGGQTVSDAIGTNVTYFDFVDKTVKTGTIRSREVYNGIAGDSTGKVAVYESFSEIYPTPEPNLPTDTNAVQQRFAIDRKTGMAVPDPKNLEKVGADVNNSYSKHCGLIIKFPIGTKKVSYPFWDVTTLSCEHPMEFQAEDSVNGVKAYRFKQTIPDTDLSAQQPNLHYASERTVWVDPITGVILKGTQTVATTLGAPSDATKTTILSGTLTFTDDNVAAMVKRAKDAQSKVTQIKVLLPLLCLVLGIVAVVAGLLLVRGASTGGEHAAANIPRPMDEPTAPFRT